MTRSNEPVQGGVHRSWGRLDGQHLGALFALIVLLHAAKIPNQFSWLDHRDIEAGRSLLAVHDLPSAMARPFSDTHFYRPLVTLSHSLNFAVFGLNPYAFHAFSVALHGLICICLAFAAKVVFRMTDRASLVSAFCFGISPVGFLPAGQISHVSELLLALFYLLSLICYRVHTSHATRRGALGFVTAFSLALLAKESALVFIPGSLLILEFFPPSGWSREKAIRLLSLTIIPAVGYLLARFSVLPGGWGIAGQPEAWGSWLAVRVVNYATHLVYLLNPSSPELSDVVPSRNFFSLPVWISLAGLLMMAALLFKLRDLTLRTALLLIFFLAAPTLNLLPLPRFFSSHYLYLPGLMFSIALASLLARENRALKALILCWMGVALVGTVTAGKRLHDDYALFSPAVEKDPNYREGHFYLGGYFLSQASPEEAERHYFASLKPLSDFHSYYDPMAGSLGLALAEISLKNYSDAEAILRAIAPNAFGVDLENLKKVEGLLRTAETEAK